MMEYWTLLDKNRKPINRIVKRGDTLKDTEYHLVINAWIRNKKGEYLISQRSPQKSHPLMWETTGGSALKDETSLDAAIREVQEELGIRVSKENAHLVGSTLRYYKGCPDILDVYIFQEEVDVNSIKFQEEELCGVQFATKEKIEKLLEEGKFEANAFFDRVLNGKKKVYYIDFDTNNAICNEDFFAGSISLYPNKEKGNIYYSKEVLQDVKNNEFLEKYKYFIEKTCRKILSQEPDAEFICFHEIIQKLCKDIKNIHIITRNKKEILDLLNDQFQTRKFIAKEVPTLPSIFQKASTLNYENLKQELSSDKIVIQRKNGDGESSTYLIEKEEDLKQIENSEEIYAITAYKRHIPLNATCIIGEYDTLLFPMSAQLISLENHKYKYIGGDFLAYKNLPTNIKENFEKYNIAIAKMVKELGYRGILGIDYILTENQQIYFMEISPGFQASSFLISQNLKRYCTTTLAELHYLSLTKKKIGNIHLEELHQSFLNCNENQQYKQYEYTKIVENGYFKDNPTSYYRKIYDRSLLQEDIFENINLEKL